MTLDKVDNAIIRLLRENGRMSNREVARLLDVSEGMVRQRIKKLTDAKAMRLGLITDVEAAGFLSSALLRVKTEPGEARSLAASLVALDCCTFVSLTLGRYDVMAIFIAQNRGEIAALIDQHVTSRAGISRLDVVEPVYAKKHRYDLVYLP